MSNTHGIIDFEKFRNLTQEQRGEAVATILSNYVNILGGDGETFVETIMQDHRTLQQSVFGLFLQLVKQWAKVEHYDPRNEFTCEMSAHIQDLFEKKFGEGSMQAPFI